MGQPDIKEIEAGLKDWDFVRNLPAAIGDYTLCRAPASTDRF